MIFLARGFIDYGNAVTNMYDDIFINFDFPIAVVALILLLFVIIKSHYLCYVRHINLLKQVFF